MQLFKANEIDSYKQVFGMNEAMLAGIGVTPAHIPQFLDDVKEACAKRERLTQWLKDEGLADYRECLEKAAIYSVLDLRATATTRERLVTMLGRGALEEDVDRIWHKLKPFGM